MPGDIAENLRDTFPGRLLIEWLLDWHQRHPEFDSAQQYAHSLTTQDFSGMIGMTLSSYLYGDGFKEVAALDATDPYVVSMSEAIARSLRAPERDTLRSPQIHHGHIASFRTPSINNQRYPCALPEGAFWSAPTFENGDDAWRLHGEHNERRSPHRYEVAFDPSSTRIARIDSYEDWSTLLDAHPLRRGETLLPDWPAISEQWDAVHVTVSGLLCAQPRISRFPYEDPMTGETHSKSGSIIGVGAWSIPSTAWLRIPEDFEIRSASQITFESTRLEHTYPDR